MAARQRSVFWEPFAWQVFLLALVVGGVEGRMSGYNSTYLFRVDDIGLEGGPAGFLAVVAVAEHVGEWLARRGILHSATQAGAIAYVRGCHDATDA